MAPTTPKTVNNSESAQLLFIDYPHGPLVRRIPVGAGRRVETFAHLLAEHPEQTQSSPNRQSIPVTGDDDASWRAGIEAKLADLQAQLDALCRKVGDQEEEPRATRLPEEY